MFQYAASLATGSSAKAHAGPINAITSSLKFNFGNRILNNSQVNQYLEMHVSCKTRRSTSRANWVTFLKTQEKKFIDRRKKEISINIMQMLFIFMIFLMV